MGKKAVSLFSPLEPGYLLLIVTVSIFLAEFGIMFFLPGLGRLPASAMVLGDSFLLIVIVFPALYFFLYLPQRRTLDQLQKVNKELEMMDQRKSQFVANVSHEFKNPLAIIKGFFSLFRDGLGGDLTCEQEELLTHAERNTDRLIRLATNLLDVSAIESGKMKLRKEIFNITVMLVDELISGEVSIKLSEQTDEILFEISNTGLGIPKEYYEKIFEKFKRIFAESTEGTGLGLPIAKDIVLLHSGRILIESSIEGRTKFTVALPRSKGTSIPDERNGQPGN